MNTQQCDACDQAFVPRPQAPQQRYCSNPACQRERRRQWQAAKLKTDPDYRDNQASAQQAWCKRNPEYWREYRANHKAYQERNRAQQQQRNAKRNGAIAKMAVSNPKPGLCSGVYLISPVMEQEIAKMDAWIVEITLLSATNPDFMRIAKR